MHTQKDKTNLLLLNVQMNVTKPTEHSILFSQTHVVPFDRYINYNTQNSLQD